MYPGLDSLLVELVGHSVIADDDVHDDDCQLVLVVSLAAAQELVRVRDDLFSLCDPLVDVLFLLCRYVSVINVSNHFHYYLDVDEHGLEALIILLHLAEVKVLRDVPE